SGNGGLGMYTIGPLIKLHGQSLLVGNIGDIFNARSTAGIINRGTIEAFPGDDLRIYALFTNFGSIHISSNCTVQVGYDFNQASSGKLEIDLAGTTAGVNYGQFKIGVHPDRNFGPGNASLDGVLNLNLVAPFEPLAADQF